uniref:tRNA (guanine-N(7)-)-methyltransferase n=1 Tax=Hemiselmis andersenii TaxID=464988 RepID=A0A6T8JI12_HEMAN|mmetsp:Transcript_18004/g.41640  ORF Transcript_18004/g.41640 Transcript_18004/m.41640 type:complete len:265 (+) Transcript_18004:72-866(+)|eukprot:CAMPEP_0114152668 /NCGR_PEP_ID=MMETSP0043_2-20121206/23931_1 /TAXON_ID=464988 /ORGANISM="Hemiselmis andersenii, Strain CCMP644" /LENGTH=264 /DNA_ID=CAMNT_0001247625 /DNA_START=1 /DNA_END=795 /DNA_ORIENTATION=-
MSGFTANSGRHFSVEVEEDGGVLRKRKFRSRAHANPLADPQFEYPVDPNSVDWSQVYQEYCKTEGGKMDRPIDFADIGCGFGGLLLQLGKKFPDKVSIGIEIREKVSSYVDQKIRGLRAENKGEYQNVACIRTNAMKCITNYFPKGGLEKLFFCFADPHFKAKNHRRRVINRNSLSEYAYILKEGGILYVITDVKELHEWQIKHLDEHPLFDKISEQELKDDLCFELIQTSSEESIKVERNAGSKFSAAYRRLPLAAAVAKMEA